MFRDGNSGTPVRPPDTRPWRNEGVMGKIVETTLDMKAMRSMDPSDYLAPMDVIMDEAAFLKHVLASASLPNRRKVSRCMQQHEVVLTDFGIFRRRRIGEEKCFYSMALFTVLKKNGELRLIQDCRPLNQAYEKPPEMFLPKIHELIQEVLGNEYVGQADAISMFYQFALHEEVQKYFAVLLNGPRGAYTEGRMTRMSMGFSWAPAIGQRCANVLIRDLGVVWVDNFLLLAKTTEEYEAKRKVFLDRCHSVNMQLDDEAMLPKKQTIALGVDMDLSKKRYRMDPEWAENTATKITAALQHELDVHALYEISGSLIWRNHVMMRKLCHCPHLLNALSVYGSQVAKRIKRWDSLIDLTAELREEILCEVTIMRANAFRGREVSLAPEVDIWTDSSLSHCAYLIFRNQRLIASGQSPVPDQHIFYSELSVAIEAIQRAHAMGFKAGNMFIDNAPTAICIERRASSNFAANRSLAKLPEFETHVTWVPSAEELADDYTRPPDRLPSLPPPAPPPDGSRASVATANSRASLRVRALGLHTF